MENIQYVGGQSLLSIEVSKISQVEQENGCLTRTSAYKQAGTLIPAFMVALLKYSSIRMKPLYSKILFDLYTGL